MRNAYDDAIMPADWGPAHTWHSAVNEKDLEAARAVAADDIVVGGPRGGAVGTEAFIDWIEHAGIHLQPVSWHPVDDNTIVVEQIATWPHNAEATPGAEPLRVATLFRVEGHLVSSAVRFDELRAALTAAST